MLHVDIMADQGDDMVKISLHLKDLGTGVEMT